MSPQSPSSSSSLGGGVPGLGTCRRLGVGKGIFRGSELTGTRNRGGEVGNASWQGEGEPAREEVGANRKKGRPGGRPEAPPPLSFKAPTTPPPPLLAPFLHAMSSHKLPRMPPRRPPAGTLRRHQFRFSLVDLIPWISSLVHPLSF
jgi:hypothetical protein